jgi:hypothetical protein
MRRTASTIDADKNKAEEFKKASNYTLNTCGPYQDLKDTIKNQIKAP